jgi:hypothetical protein
MFEALTKAGRRVKQTPVRSTLSLAAFAIAGVAAFSGASCSDARPDAASTTFNPFDPSNCTTMDARCPCNAPGAVAQCSHVARSAGNYATCQSGTRTCLADGQWSTCEGDVEVRTKSFSIVPLNLATTTSQCANPCDPNCKSYSDTPDGLTLDAGLELVDGGLTVSATGSTPGFATCTGITVTPVLPDTGTLTITQLSPVMPSTITYEAQLQPPGCYPGAFNPLWTIQDDRKDRAYITDIGGARATVTVVSPIASTIDVAAYAGGLGGLATAQINVDVVDTTSAGAYNLSFPTTTGTADNVTILYPYADTVLPLALLPPIPQWESVNNADSVKVTLRYVNGATSFRWARIGPENNGLTIVTASPNVDLAAGKRYPNIPPYAWKMFERSARGRTADIAIQRHRGGQLHQETATTIRFANSQLKGNVYYQSYGTQLARNFLGSAQDSTGGRVFPGGAMGAATLAITPGASQPTVVAGSPGANPPDGAGTYCRVCHTASANGSMVITQKFGGGNKVSQRYVNLTGTPTFVDMPNSDGRYAWPAIYPTSTTTAGFLFGNAGVSDAYNTGPAPGGLDGSNTSFKSALYSVATTGLGSNVASIYRTGGGTPVDLTVGQSSANWGLNAAVPVFSSSGDKVALNHYNGRVCATNGAANCTADELLNGDKRSLAIMDYAEVGGTKRFSNFRRLVTEPNAPCNTTFHPTAPCTIVWPTFMPNNGVVYEREVFHNGHVGKALYDFGGTRSGCDENNANCNNDGMKGELWWVNTTGAAQPTRLNRANGRNAAGVSTLPVGTNTSPFCRVSGFTCTAGGDCCSGTCSQNRCTAVKRMAGTGCGAASECESNICVGGTRCGCMRDADCGTSCNIATGACTGGYYTPPTMSYQPGHNATVEPALNYEPTMNPNPTYDAAGNPEYYWVLFTSRRMFGNIATINPWWSDPRRRDISQTVTPKKLWVAAISANPAAGTDPSFPAFYLPGQEWIAGNSKAYWVQEACRAGNAARPPASQCDSDLDCCAGSTCSLDVPNAPTKHCIPVTACVNLGGACTLDSDCCGGVFCSGGTCQNPPPLPQYGASATFTRDFYGACSSGEKVVWRLLEYQAQLPTNTSIIFSASTADLDTGLATATPVVSIGTASPPSTTGWTGFPNNIDDLLGVAGSDSKRWLRLFMTLNPSVDQTNRPILNQWRVTFDCVPSE